MFSLTTLPPIYVEPDRGVLQDHLLFTRTPERQVPCVCVCGKVPYNSITRFGGDASLSQTLHLFQPPGTQYLDPQLPWFSSYFDQIMCY